MFRKRIFCAKLDMFEEITVSSYSQQVHTSDISENRKAAITETKEWLETARGQKIKQTTADGYELVATEFFAEQDSHKWVLLLHGYTGWKEKMYPFAYWYHTQGYHVLVPDLRCQGESGGYDLKNASAIEGVKRSHTPTLFIHGEQDAMIDVNMSKELYEAVACEKELLIVEGAGHAQSQDKAPESYYGTINAFLGNAV